MCGICNECGWSLIVVTLLPGNHQMSACKEDLPTSPSQSYSYFHHLSDRNLEALMVINSRPRLAILANFYQNYNTRQLNVECFCKPMNMLVGGGLQAGNTLVGQLWLIISGHVMEKFQFHYCVAYSVPVD